MNYIFNLINLAAVEKTKQTNIIECQYSTGIELERNKKIKLKKNVFYFFFKFQKNGSGGSVKGKIKKLWPRLRSLKTGANPAGREEEFFFTCTKLIAVCFLVESYYFKYSWCPQNLGKLW